MILAWVMSLLLLCSSLIVYLERLTVLRLVEVKTIELAQEQFMAAESAVIKCENHILNLSALTENDCLIQPTGKNQWLITSKEKPTIQVHVLADEKSGFLTRLSWRQAFE